MDYQRRILGLVDLRFRIGERSGLSSISVNWARPWGGPASQETQSAPRDSSSGH
ncbi:hypothetical protein AS9A_1575 [Hoyosella subflava DQS3-9A1]|uniref:Uncharacterized protein n=1 Tax=Hoyosella subflava (strain DSM 45089 / JCM 17490 / NBRC 109087 / DQS3-9A1) TaxID=443218 RepID=F6EIW3_HOYSD|nr:hypothetical protein AS9A_1575 [Hoyosella subflava DQS3-9A1]